METLPENDSEDTSVLDRKSSTANLTSLGIPNNNSGESSASDSEEGIVVHFGEKHSNTRQQRSDTLDWVPSLPGFDENSPQLSRYNDKDRSDAKELSQRDKLGLDEAKKWRSYTIQSLGGDNAAEEVIANDATILNKPPPPTTETEDSVIDIPDVVIADPFNNETKF